MNNEFGDDLGTVDKEKQKNDKDRNGRPRRDKTSFVAGVKGKDNRKSDEYSASRSCQMCSEQHGIWQCKQFKQLLVSDRKKKAADKALCFKTPTRICNQTRTRIDLVFVNNSHRVVESGVIYSAISDHSIVYCTIKSGVSKAPPKTIEYRSYRTFDRNSFIQDLKSIDWDIIDEIQDLDAAVETWNTLFSDVADKHASKEPKHPG